ncbi:hypothetical protein Pmani_011803 [Petrolisthes manimaculis]|uniref:Uncharacterized protein n=1 Tax=Petrolisthes manimaculis TaxID=1843537 RepID=A0AAE1Q0D0_9EUCA|nr:hypothetical protein Pmani_011803 [Petrolisthes manimaculis]
MHNTYRTVEEGGKVEKGPKGRGQMLGGEWGEGVGGKGERKARNGCGLHSPILTHPPSSLHPRLRARLTVGRRDIPGGDEVDVWP